MCLQNPGQPVGTFRDAIALAADGAVKLPDPRGVEDRLIDFDQIIVEPASQPLETSLHQIAIAGGASQPLETSLHQIAIAGGQFYAVETMSAVSRVADNWIGPALHGVAPREFETLARQQANVPGLLMKYHLDVRDQGQSAATAA